MVDDPPDTPILQPRRGRAWQRWVAGIVLVLLLAIAGAALWLDTGAGHRFLISRIERVEPRSGLRIKVGAIEGSIYSKARLRDLQLYDPNGLFFFAPQVSLDWWPVAWISNRLDIDRLYIPQATLHQLPKFRPTEVRGPILPDFDIRLMQLKVDRLVIAKGLAGREQVATLQGDADIRAGRAVIDLQARVLNGADSIILALDSRPGDNRFDVDVTVNAPKGGVLGAMAGLKQDANLRVQGDGTWARWSGTAIATLDKVPAVSLRLGAKRGQYQLTGNVEGEAIAGNGLLRRLSAPRLDLTAAGTLENRVVDGVLKLSSPAIDMTADGAIDLRGNGFDNMLIDVKLARPQALLKTMTGRDITARIRLDGPIPTVGFEYLVSAKQVAFGKTILRDVRANGEGRRAQSGPVIVPIQLSARQMDGQGNLVGGIVRNFTLAGALQFNGQTITSTPLKIRSDKLRGAVVVLADLRTGRYDIALTGDINGLLIPGLGVVDIRSKVQAVPGANGRFTLKGQAQAKMRRLDNSFFRTLGGGLPRLSSNLSLGPDGRLMFTGLRLDTPLLNLTATGYRRPDKTFHFEGAGKHRTYGPVTLVLDGIIERPTVDLVLARPLEAAALRNVKVHLAPDPIGYRFTAAGGSILGPFDGNGVIALPKGAQAVIDVERLAVAGVLAKGRILPVTGGLDGRLAVTGPVTGYVALTPLNGIQQIRTELTAADARFEGPTPIGIRRGTLDATLLLDPAGTTIDAETSARGLLIGPMRINRMEGAAKLVGGKGKVTASILGQRGRLFDIRANADVAPGRVALMIGGTLDRQPIRLTRAAVFTQTEEGWRLAPVTISYRDGSAQLAGRLGGEATEIEARLNKLPLALLDLVNEELGLGGLATGTLSYAKPRDGAPTGTANLRIRKLTRSGLALTSRPVDVGVNAILTPTRLAARATITAEGKTIGRAQALLSPLGQGDLMQRVRIAPLFAQLRYNGTADTLWRLTGVEIIDLSGPAAVAADVRGTLDNPIIAGSIASDNATIDSPITGMRLTGVKARGRFAGSQLAISSFSGNARGGGTVTGSGRFDFGGGKGVAMDLAMQADNATLLARDDLGATVTGPITIRSSGVGGTIGGDVELNRSRFTLGRAAAVAAIPELRVIETSRRGDDFERVTAAAPWNLDIKARARNRLTVTGLGLNSEWRANLDIGGTVTAPSIRGAVDLVRGGYEFAGRRFELTEGRIRFDGSTPNDPTLDIDAAANINGINATIRVTGTSLKPLISFTSIPALPEDELLSRLLFGTSITNLSAPEALQLASAVTALQGGGGGLDPINAVRKAAGLDRLRILPADPTIGQGTSVAAGKYLTRKTYVELITDGQGYSATRIEYQVTRWLSLLSSVSTIGRQSVNVRVSKDY
ncbi:MAG: translocation/assembly module TamB domain-containing protein [Sphingobium sp.]|uniref:translocation/assembly module TamB domain-containing protein n=1 Tax=Sphingobium sp. TaxID=1912891 RepID=UPI0029A01F99|nr:translocation/assembly module TamB domain-containing protein [Sphingobium sp.]MDX3908828.1 translocation/assembly module TamB domain-containing protein [Sphingobium sp.]